MGRMGPVKFLRHNLGALPVKNFWLAMIDGGRLSLASGHSLLHVGCMCRVGGECYCPSTTQCPELMNSSDYPPTGWWVLYCPSIADPVKPLTPLVIDSSRSDSLQCC